jgi:hypothetical protein
VTPSSSLSGKDDKINSDDPNLTVPIPRYNAMLAVLRNTLYMCDLFSSYIHHSGVNAYKLRSYGGILERGAREYTLDDFHYLSLDRMDRFVCLRPPGVIIPEGEEESSSDEDNEDDESSSGETEATDREDEAVSNSGTNAEEDDNDNPFETLEDATAAQTIEEVPLADVRNLV